MDGASPLSASTPKMVIPQLQGILCKVCSPFFHGEFKLAHRCVCIMSNISTLNSFECMKKQNDRGIP